MCGTGEVFTHCKNGQCYVTWNRDHYNNILKIGCHWLDYHQKRRDWFRYNLDHSKQREKKEQLSAEKKSERHIRSAAADPPIDHHVFHAALATA